MRLGRKLSEGFAVDRDAEAEIPVAEHTDHVVPVSAEIDHPEPVGSGQPPTG